MRPLLSRSWYKTVHTASPVIYSVLWACRGVKTCIIGCTGSETDCSTMGKFTTDPLFRLKGYFTSGSKDSDWSDLTLTE